MFHFCCHANRQHATARPQGWQQPHSRTATATPPTKKTLCTRISQKPSGDRRWCLLSVYTPASAHSQALLTKLRQPYHESSTRQRQYGTICAGQCPVPETAVQASEKHHATGLETHRLASRRLRKEFPRSSMPQEAGAVFPPWCFVRVLGSWWVPLLRARRRQERPSVGAASSCQRTGF